MKSFIINASAIFVVLIIIVGIGIGAFYLKRSMHYKLAYETMVQEQVDKAMTDHLVKYHNVGAKDTR